jgi:hypothetical protein
MKRRDALKWIAGSAACALAPQIVAASDVPDEFFIFIHAGGGWDVTLWADPRNERRGLIDPATSANTDIGGLERWKPAGASFEIMTSSSGMRLGPAVGKLHDLRDRLTIINGIAMNTVSHEDGVTYSTTGRHRTGGAVAESSIDVVVANELGAGQLMPVIAVRFPSALVGDRLDRRVVPLRVSGVDAITAPFVRSTAYLDGTDRDAIVAVLTEEARSLAAGSTHPAVYEQLASQYQALPPLLGGDFVRAFGTPKLRSSYPEFEYQGRLGEQPVAAAFAIEAFKRNIARCMGFGFGGFDTHTSNHRQHALLLQEMFNVIAALIKVLDATPHPTRPTARLSEHTHILVLSEFCRTPQFNPNGGRDHYPNNSALMISPRLRAGRTFGRTDEEQLLPATTPDLFGGQRPVAPPDVLATFLAAMGIDARRYMRDGEVMRALLP